MARFPGGLQDAPGSSTHVPNASKPKVRPPRGWRDQVVFPGRSLPTYTGPYSVGTAEIEVPAQHPRHFSHIKREGRHVLQLETVLMTLYYPTSHQDRNLSQPDTKLSRELWLGRPRGKIAGGYARFVGLPEWVGLGMFLPAMYTKLPAYRNAPLASHWAPPMNTKTSAKGAWVKTEQGTRPEGASEEPSFPLILFSHGLGGMRTMYSSVCGEFASYGFVVVAIEHRDGSGPRTYINHRKSGHSTMTDMEKDGNLDHRPEEGKKGYDIIDYIFPKDNPFDTSPHNDKGVDHELRDAQTELRLAELEEAYMVMQEIHAGHGDQVSDRNLRRAGYKASSSHGLKGLDWSKWHRRFHLDHTTACGHSFGAATVVEMLRQKSRFPYIGQGIIYDIWGAGASAHGKEDSVSRIQAPLLAINSEAFTYWPSNFEFVSGLAHEAQAEPHPSPAWLLTLRGTVHVSQSDFSLLYRNVCSLFLKMVADPQRALDLNINASLEFLAHVLPAELAQVSRAYQNEGLLESETAPLDRVPSSQMHRPSDKFIAMRLKIRHEWLYRLSPQLFAKLDRKKARREGRKAQSDDEIWLHVKPTKEAVERHLQANEGRSNNKKAKFEGALPMTGNAEEDGEPAEEQKVTIEPRPVQDQAFG
ncbi:hypothetical protein B0A50_06042 [Salinomyces thailandicus]|uniref:1-alkyl-2-acetylglycerophosphocholine esterase n=1 Tax=Salinomyces thailandicus TaxID=706561 RepID=A0A4U0TS36_9PEZI|nr:hypothetical protein B0A50_06042 [Salinomyces thailandica]